MVRFTPNNKESMAGKQRKSYRKKYVKPGALASQLRTTRATNSNPNPNPNAITNKNRLLIFDSPIHRAPPVLHSTPKPLPTTPRSRLYHRLSDSPLESLPMDLLVKILCHLHHDQLRPVFHVSEKLRKAVILARQFHFNYTTPDRTRQEMLRTKTPLPNEHWPFISKGNGRVIRCPSPHTPKAPRQPPRPHSRYKASDAEVRQITTVLFRESAFPQRCILPPGLPKSVCKSFPSNRALFCEDELCQAVSQNKLR
ncbi:hypothetical protein GIB67_040812 [Kingdonia uniflora]|uniref:F-box domain-containing protein n=1 Tax=Kingdonia uniflora TaxID=39325 RepID=A0A7J7P4E9_9MAGN|nr:hypothetical protein GIB67_040812 [Kingdonia uniflora]